MIISFERVIRGRLADVQYNRIVGIVVPWRVRVIPMVVQNL
jgi:hypothetical protein